MNGLPDDFLVTVALADGTALSLAGEAYLQIGDAKASEQAFQAALKAATEAFRAAEEAVKTARLQPFALDKAVTAARDRVESLTREQTRREARAQALDEALARLAHVQAHGDSDHAFGWSYLNEAQLWKSHRCTQVAAE